MQRFARAGERLLLSCGTVLVAFWGIAFLHQRALAALDLASFHEAPALEAGDPAPQIDASAGDVAERGVGGAGRAIAGLANAAPFSAERLGVLEAPAIDLEVVVLGGTSVATLNRGVGSIAGTAVPGGPGNAGIAGHRDGAFRGLGTLAVGDEIRITTREGDRVVYRVAWTRVVRPEDVWVLEGTAEPSLTLVTCHPFHYLGPAPDRYIVRAVASPDVAARR